MTQNRGICFSLPVDSALGLASNKDKDISEMIDGIDGIQTEKPEKEASPDDGSNNDDKEE